MKFCPFLTNSNDGYFQCTSNCALFADNNQCAIKNLGNIKVEKSNEDDDE